MNRPPSTPRPLDPSAPLSLGALWLLYTACSSAPVASGVGAPFSETWRDDQGKSIAALEQRLRSKK
ncbi:MAG TPA: hypothetical protein VJN18_18565, partial [Polyangiaceae bacterium]|nr:hypothetical protein [Polyangiaceae bacterium]